MPEYFVRNLCASSDRSQPGGARRNGQAGDLLNTTSESRHRLTGIALMCGAVACFAFLDTTAKYLNNHMDTLQVVWARYMSAFALTLLISNPVSRPGLVLTSRPLLQVGRGVLLLLSSVFNFLALRYLQLDEVLAIMFSQPFLVAVLAGPMLGEWVGWRRWIAICAGFVGVVVVTRPGYGGIHPAALYALAGALCLALYGIATRALARTDSNETTLFYSNMVGALMMAPVLPFVWSNPGDWHLVGLMMLMGVFGGFGHYLLIAGHRGAPASVLAPFMYTQLVWVVTLGYLVFGNVPNRWTLAGAAIVIASGLYLFHRERVRGIPPQIDPLS
jgi:drug/metabolite transporter (DMT)-like permease